MWHGSGVTAVQIGEWLPESIKCAGLPASLLDLGKEDSAQTLPPMSIPPQIFSILN